MGTHTVPKIIQIRPKLVFGSICVTPQLVFHECNPPHLKTNTKKIRISVGWFTFDLSSLVNLGQFGWLFCSFFFHAKMEKLFPNEEIERLHAFKPHHHERQVKFGGKISKNCSPTKRIGLSDIFFKFPFFKKPSKDFSGFPSHGFDCARSVGG